MRKSRRRRSLGRARSRSSRQGPILVTLVRLPRKRGGKKFKVEIEKGGRRCTVRFGLYPYSDYTVHGDLARKRRYILRHTAREDHGATGICTAGFWSRWLLWNKRSISASKASIVSRFGVTFVRGRL